MNDLDRWGVDIFKIGELSNNRPLTAVTYTILQVLSHLCINSKYFCKKCFSKFNKDTTYQSVVL